MTEVNAVNEMRFMVSCGCFAMLLLACCKIWVLSLLLQA